MTRLSGVTARSSMAAAMVTTLLTEPGSNTDVRARFSEVSVGGAPSTVVPTLARARTSPESVSTTMAVPARPPTAMTCSASIRSIWNCIARSSVSTRSVPGTACSSW